MITVYNPETRAKKFNAFQIKLYYRYIDHNISKLLSKSEQRPPPFNVSVMEVRQPHNSRAKKFNKAANNEIERLIKIKHRKLFSETRFQKDPIY